MGAIDDVMALEDQEKLDQQQAASNARQYNADGSAKANDFQPPKLPESAFPARLDAGPRGMALPGLRKALKTTIGGERLEIVVEDAAQLPPAIAATRSFADGRPEPDEAGRRLIVPLRESVRLVDVVRALDAEGVEAVDVQRREATLDDVFLTLTGSRPAEEPQEEIAA